jgi:glycolate oxidase FAD binding subunit
MSDIQQALLEQVVAAQKNNETLGLLGSGSKMFLLPSECISGQPVDLTRHTGVVSYEPTELVITARGGTPLAEINALLSEHNQMLPFDPPMFGGKGTIGGAVAMGLAGPGRPWCGAPRDAILGIKLLDGEGRIVEFGGQVMKNVAGYDISRLMCGAMGTLGILLEVSIRLIPRARVERTLRTNMGYDEARQLLNTMRSQSVPLTGAFWHQEQLRLRLSAASETALNKLQKRIGGEWLTDNTIWQQLRDQELDFFTASRDSFLWRLSTPPAAEVPQQEQHLLDWGGAQHWVRMQTEWRDPLDAIASAFGGHAQPWFRTPGHASSENEAINRLQVNLEEVFNRNRVFNPGCCNG